MAKEKAKAKKTTAKKKDSVKKGAETKKAKAKPAKADKKSKKAEKPAKEEKKGKKGGKTSAEGLTPLQKAQLARKNGTGKKKAKKAKVTFKAPADLKPIFLKADLVLGKDGHMTQSRLTAIKGKLGSDTAKTVDLSLYDPATANSAVARLAGPMFIKSEKKRLPAGMMLSATFRVMKNKAGLLGVRLKEVKAKLPEKKAKAVDKKDVIYRTVRKAARPMEAAFTKLKPFPSNKELKALTADDSEE